jgi:hypothetical protein
MEEYEFKSHWSNMETSPANATRCLVTDGDVVITATYLQQDGKTSVWVFQGLETDKEKFNVVGWMPMPRPMKKPYVVLISKNEIPIDKNMGGD